MRKLKRELRLMVKRLLFVFRRPRYSVGDVVTVAGFPHVIVEVRRSWKYAVFFYRIGDNFSASESVLDFFNDN